MRENPDRKQRRSIRLKGYDYTSSGAYFVTICTRGREMVFGEVVGDVVRLSKWGEIIQSWWHNIPSHFDNVECDEFVIMPNHVHGIILITDSTVGVGSPDPGARQPGWGQHRAVQHRAGPFGRPYDDMGNADPRRPTLGQIVAYFKYQSTKHINQIDTNSGRKIWQRNYYERVIRDEDDLNRAREYILDNPGKWAEDGENPGRSRGGEHIT
jgi:putative transposase